MSRYFAPVADELLAKEPRCLAGVEGLTVLGVSELKHRQTGWAYRLVEVEDDAAPTEADGEIVDITLQSHFDEHGVCTRVTVMSREALDPAVLA